MAMWLYQLTQAEWTPNEYRLDVWEGERTRWQVGRIVGGEEPRPGDTAVFFFAKTDCPSPGFCGWAVILQWVQQGDQRRVDFRPVAPSDQLKMRPWWNDEAQRIAGERSAGTHLVVLSGESATNLKWTSVPVSQSG